MNPEAVLVTAFALLWGGLWGSFLNVVVYRVPAGLSVVHPRSRCPHCLTAITWWQNIPVLSWLLLRGQCFQCKAPISLRYPAVEAVAAALSLAVVLPWLPALLDADLQNWRLWLVILGEQAFVFTWLAIALIDADTFLIPDVMSLPMPLAGVALAAAVGAERGVSWQQAAAGALVAGGGLWLVQWGYGRLTGREGLGFGDVKLLAGMGALLGIQAIGAVILAAAVQGLLFALGYVLVSRGKAVEERGLQSLRHLALPFGPFLVLAAVQWLLGQRALMPLVQAYLDGQSSWLAGGG